MRGGELGDPELPIALHIGLRSGTAERSCNAGEIARFLLRAGRVAFEPLRERAQVFQIEEPRNGWRQIGQRLPVFAQEPKCALARTVIGEHQIVELRETASQCPGHQCAPPGIRCGIGEASAQG